jgi:hypothetical protein
MNKLPTNESPYAIEAKAILKDWDEGNISRAELESTLISLGDKIATALRSEHQDYMSGRTALLLKNRK